MSSKGMQTSDDNKIQNIDIIQDVNIEDIIVIEQSPKITQKLQLLSSEIDKQVSEALALVVTNDTVTQVRKVRADLNKKKEVIDRKRIEIKNKIMTPYDEFEKVCKELVLDKFENADKELKNKINNVESVQKSKKWEEVKQYFDEYKGVKLVDFLEYEQLRKVKEINLTHSLKSLKTEAKEFIDKISDELNSIKEQEYSEEITVEYKKHFNLANAISTVASRKKAIEEERKRKEQIKIQEEIKREAISRVKNILPSPKKEILSTIEISAPVVKKIVDETKEEVFTLNFKVIATKEKLRELKKFLIDGGYKYE